MTGAILQMINHGLSTGALFLLVGHHLRAAAHAHDRGVRRPLEADAGLRHLLPDHHHVVDRAAGAQRLHRRVHDPGRRLRAQLGVGDLRRASASCSARPTCCGCTSASSSGRSTTRRTRSSRTSTAARSRISLPLVVLCFWIGLYPKPFFEVLEQPVNYVVARVDKDYAEELRAAGTLPTLEAELATGGAAGRGARRREVGHGPARRRRLPLSRAGDPAHRARARAPAAGARSPTSSARRRQCAWLALLSLGATAFYVVVAADDARRSEARAGVDLRARRLLLRLEDPGAGLDDRDRPAVAALRRGRRVPRRRVLLAAAASPPPA